MTSTIQPTYGSACGLPDQRQIRAQPDQDLGGNALAFRDQPQEDVMRADTPVTKPRRFSVRQVQSPHGPWRERDVSGRVAITHADDFLDLLPHRLDADSE